MQINRWKTVPMQLGVFIALSGAAAISVAQSAHWEADVWCEPQVRYLVADMTLGGDVALYRKYAAEGDPDSREAVRLWDSGVRVVNRGEFERKRIANALVENERVMRVVFRGSNRTITGKEVLLDSDRDYEQAPMRVILADLTLGAAPATYERDLSKPAAAEAIRRWNAGARATNSDWFETEILGAERRIVYRGTKLPIDGAQVRLNSDAPYRELNVRYFLADIYLGGGRQFYDRVAESAHETACREAVSRFDAGVTIVNLSGFERKKVGGKTLITRKGSDERISGSDIKLSTD